MRKTGHRNFYGTLTLGEAKNILAVAPRQTGYSLKRAALHERIWDRIQTLATEGRIAEAYALEERLYRFTNCGGEEAAR